MAILFILEKSGKEETAARFVIIDGRNDYALLTEVNVWTIL